LSAPKARLVLGLGNPGAEYDGTRHNVGFDVLDRVAERLGRPFLTKGRALVASTRLPQGARDPSSTEGGAGEVQILLAKPTTFMNRSGRAARDLLDEQDGPVEVLVICDDFNLPLGKLRCRRKGSAGGQKGLASIIELTGGGDLPRLRVGIGDPGRVPVVEYVLRPFKRGEQATVDEMLDRAAVAVSDWLSHGDFDRLMRDANSVEP
jgi:PTH1 family peptidyl-tRNA hydrolase